MVTSRQVDQPSFSPQVVNRVVDMLKRSTRSETQEAWLSAVCSRVSRQKPRLAGVFVDLLGVSPLEGDPLGHLQIGEVSVCYEALLATLDSASRRDRGQFFTPDDAARFMAERAVDFPSGVWLDPCCGVGNLAWHLAAVQPDPASFVAESLILIDKDATALLSAIALLAGEYLADGDEAALRRFYSTSQPSRDALTKRPLPEHDFVIMNPPYTRALSPACIVHTTECRDLFAFFMERVLLSSRGFVAVTPASYLSAPKFAPLRELINTMRGGDIYVFDNVPDTLFRGYKYGSNNTSKTNFVRAAVTVCSPSSTEWRITPILRWKAESRVRMFAKASDFLLPRRIGPHGEWVKLVPGAGKAWDRLLTVRRRLSDLVTHEKTPWHLDVALTPRYYVSASVRVLDRSSKATLYFPDRSTRDIALVVLNSSVPYLMWRALDGGVTLPRRVLMSVPIPDLPKDLSNLVGRLSRSERSNVTIKINAGRNNENVRHPSSLVADLDGLVLPEILESSGLLYAADMFSL